MSDQTTGENPTNRVDEMCDGVINQQIAVTSDIQKPLSDRKKMRKSHQPPESSTARGYVSKGRTKAVVLRVVIECGRESASDSRSSVTSHRQRCHCAAQSVRGDVLDKSLVFSETDAVIHDPGGRARESN